MAEPIVTGWKHSTTDSLSDSHCATPGCYFTLLPRYITYLNTIPWPTWRLYRVFLRRSYKHQRDTVVEYSTTTHRARVKIPPDPRNLFLISFFSYFTRQWLRTRAAADNYGVKIGCCNSFRCNKLQRRRCPLPFGLRHRRAKVHLHYYKHLWLPLFPFFAQFQHVFALEFLPEVRAYTVPWGMHNCSRFMNSFVADCQVFSWTEKRLKNFRFHSGTT